MILIFTGNGKGKTSAAIGTAVRSLGHGNKILVLQFMKEQPSGEITFLKEHPNAQIIQSGVGFYKIQGDHSTEEQHIEAAEKALEKLHQEIINFSPSLVIIDEINVACSLSLIEPAKIIKIIESNPEIDFILTGRDAPKEFTDIADLVTEMKEIKHPFQNGKPAKRGIDF